MKNLKIIEANLQHSELVWNWRNDPHTRKMFNSNHLISFKEHNQWFINVLSDKNRKMLVGLCEDIPFGMTRFDKLINEKDTYSISINICPSKRNLGLGKYLLKESILEFFFKSQDCNRVLGEIKIQNLPSCKLFESCGFKLKEINSQK